MDWMIILLSSSKTKKKWLCKFLNIVIKFHVTEDFDYFYLFIQKINEI